MRVYGVVFVFFSSLGFTSQNHAHAEEICASRYSELDKSERLKTVKELFGPERQIRAVNESKGSYVIIEALTDDLTISFFTSALFEMYAIRKDGVLSFCDTGTGLKMEGLGRSEEFTLKAGKFQMGGGGAKKTFAIGEMPEKLMKLHHMEPTGLAAKP